MKIQCYFIKNENNIDIQLLLQHYALENPNMKISGLLSHPVLITKQDGAVAPSKCILIVKIQMVDLKIIQYTCCQKAFFKESVSVLREVSMTFAESATKFGP